MVGWRKWRKKRDGRNNESEKNRQYSEIQAGKSMNSWNGYIAVVGGKLRLFWNTEPGGDVAYFLVRDFQTAARDEKDGALNPLDEVEIDDYGATDADKEVTWKMGDEFAEKKYHAEWVGVADKVNIAVIPRSADPDYAAKADSFV